MDDPWGSPWTSTTTAPERSPSPTKSDLEPPPRAFLSTNSSPRLPAVSIHSPWADENDGFGDWTAADAPAATAQSTSGWGGSWAGASSDAASAHQSLTPTPKEDGFGFGNVSPIAWPGSIALSPGSKSANGSVFRQPSPDPWASDFTLSEERRDGQDTPRFVIDEPSSPIRAENHHVTGSPVEVVESVWNRTANEGGAMNGVPHAPGLEQPHAVNNRLDSNRADDPDERTRDIRTGDTPQPDDTQPPRQSADSKLQSTQSRSSSMSRTDSDVDGERQDSPITSIDEDAKSRIVLPPRKVSGKIQELVEKFDELSKAAVDEGPSTPSTRRERSGTPHRSLSRHKGGDAEDIGDFNAFEDAEAVKEDTANHATLQTSSQSSPERSSDRTATPQMQSPESPVRYRAPSVAGTPRGRLITTSSEIHERVAKVVPAQFDVDVVELNAIFDDTEPKVSSLQPSEASTLPDHIITDNFTDISERKAWYRISRLGSSRKHNAGDDDSYRRVAWPTSTIHLETLNIVRRWMEQDSITGRTTLGGGSSRSDMFGWGSAAEPVALDQVFGKRQVQVRGRPVSLQQPVQMPPVVSGVPLPTTQTTSVTAKSPKQRPMSLAEPPVPSFGWGTDPARQQQPVNHKKPATLPNKAALDRPRDIKISSSQSSLMPQQERQAAESESSRHENHTSQALNPSVPPSASQEDDDDDWGEMISSPTGDVNVGSLNHLEASMMSSLGVSPAAPGSRRKEQSVISTTLEQSQPIASQERPMVDPWATSNRPTVVRFEERPRITTNTSITDGGFTPTTPLAVMSSLTVSAKSPIDSTKFVAPTIERQDANDALIQQIIGNLPDLSYMLR